MSNVFEHPGIGKIVQPTDLRPGPWRVAKHFDRSPPTVSAVAVKQSLGAPPIPQQLVIGAVSAFVLTNPATVPAWALLAILDERNTPEGLVSASEDNFVYGWATDAMPDTGNGAGASLAHTYMPDGLVFEPGVRPAVSLQVMGAVANIIMMGFVVHYRYQKL